VLHRPTTDKIRDGVLAEPVAESDDY